MVFQLVYHSIAERSLTAQHIQDILHAARTFNKQHQITGCLLFYKREFLQMLEGEEATVISLYENIMADKRHHHVYTVWEETSSERFYQDWSMAYHALFPVEMEELEGTLPIDNFKSLHAIKKNASHTQKMFYYIANSMMDDK